MSKLFTRIILKLARKNIIKMSDKKYLTLVGRVKLNQKMDLDNPKTFNEKLQWLKINDRNPEYTKMVDKYEAKEYISNIIGKEYIIPTIGIYEKFKDIDFEKLPDKFVIKTTHDSGSVIICKDKKNFDIKKAKEKIEKSLKRKYYNLYREWPYKNVKPRIIIEEFIENSDDKDLNDYKFWCFNGKVKYIHVTSNRGKNGGLKLDFYNINWEKMPFEWDYPKTDITIEKPQNYELMIELAEKLSKDIPYLRVDMYNLNGKIYLGELTFYTGAGFEKFNPEKYDRILGDMLELPKEKRV